MATDRCRTVCKSNVFYTLSPLIIELCNRHTRRYRNKTAFDFLFPTPASSYIFSSRNIIILCYYVYAYEILQIMSLYLPQSPTKFGPATTPQWCGVGSDEMSILHFFFFIKSENTAEIYAKIHYTLIDACLRISCGIRRSKASRCEGLW